MKKNRKQKVQKKKITKTTKNNDKKKKKLAELFNLLVLSVPLCSAGIYLLYSVHLDISPRACPLSCVLDFVLQ